MALKKNPLNLNPLQLKTLTLFQALSQMEGIAAPHDDPSGEPGHIMISHMPRPHGDHFHLGSYVVRAQDASGLANESVWTALERKKLIKSLFPMACVLTPTGVSYETGLKDQILRQGGHH
ncbi:MAG TPA: hypothetical protein VFE34_09115 [Dongiaceae bacterium]|jgi:hypothetical protein|nr:hypothetical protein [Dongiaceae bacterium]